MRKLIIVLAVAVSLLGASRLAYAEPVWGTAETTTINALSVAEDGSRIAVGTQDATAVLFSADGTALWEFAAKNVVTGVAVLPDGGLIISSDDQQVYRLGPEGQEVWSQNFGRMVKLLSASSGGDRIAISLFRGKEVLLLNDNGETTATLPVGMDVEQTAISPNGEWVAAAALDQYVYLFDAGGELRIKIPAQGKIKAIDVANDGKVAVGTLNNIVYFIDASGSLLGQLPTKDVVTSVSLPGEGDYAAISDYSGTYYISDTSGKELWSKTEARPGRQALIGADGMLYAASDAGAVYRYNVEQVLEKSASAARLQTLLLTGGSVLAAGLLALLVWWLIRKKRHILKRLWKDKVAYIMLIPSFSLIFIFLYFPSFSGLYHSLFDWNPAARSEFVGLANFRRMFDDPYVAKGGINLLILIVTGLLKTIIPPLLVAELIYHLRNKKSQYVFRTAFVISTVVPSVGTLLVWQDMFDPNMGLINQFLRLIGLGSLAHPWLGDPNTALWAVIFMGFPFVGILQLLVLYSGLISISDEVIEAAKIDGARTFRIIRSIHLPLLAGQFKLLIVLALIGIMQDFGSILIVTGGGPADSTYVPALQMYYAATKFNDLGYASALGVSMFAVILLITILNMKFIKTNEG